MRMIEHSEQIKSEIESVQASLRALKKRRASSSGSDSDEPASKKAKPKTSALSGAALLAAQRAQYLDGGKAGHAKKRLDLLPATKQGRAPKKEDDESLLTMLDGFKEELREARKQAAEAEKLKPKVAPVQSEQVLGYNGEILEQDEEDEDDNDMSFMTHQLKFRKDAVRFCLQ